jgi:hypothetical protein
MKKSGRGNKTGAVYRIYDPPAPYNTVGRCHCGGLGFQYLCVLPRRYLPRGDILATQKLGFQLDEGETYRVANKHYIFVHGTFDTMAVSMAAEDAPSRT